MDISKAKSLLNANYRRPAKRWDILNDCLEGFKTIVLIDGVFLEEYPPSPKEILTVIQQGTTVFGSSSMGALRAVELRRVGMQGSGFVYRSYLNRHVEDDDEVAVTFNYDSGKAYSYALINLRYTLGRLQENKLLTEEEGQSLFQFQKEIYFPFRTFSSLKYSCEEVFGLRGKVIFDLIKTNWIDIKALDAEVLLRSLATNSERGVLCLKN